MKNIVISILLLTIAHVSMAQLYINEISATNADQVYDTKFYNFSSWVELYNAGDAAVDLHNYYFSDDPSNPQKWQFPNDAIIESKSYLIVWCDDQNQDLHTNFNLDKDGEDLILSDADGIEVDHIIYPPQFTNVSFGRFSNGNATMAYQLKATPGEANVGSNATQRLGKVVFNTEAGKYASQQSITLSHPTAGVTIRYTTDGSEPNETSTSYSAAIVLTKTSIVKAKAFHPDFIAGQTQANTYFINERDFSLPVVSLSIAPNYLNDDMIGIYVAGTNGIPGRGTDTPVNWNQDWSRHADFEYFSPAGKRQFDQAVDVRIYGNYSRTRPQKSFAIKARNKYEDNEMKFKFFPNKTQDEYGAMVLRNSGTDWNITHFRDALMQRITIGEMDLDYLDYQPTILVLNGEYWGIQNLREKYDADYFKSNYDIDVEELDLMESNNAVLEGDAEFYKDYRDNLGDMDRTDPAAINYIENNIDVQNFIN